jgi:hypothetical protein
VVHAEVPVSVLDKIQKLLALTQSPNENEAAVAASKAQELLTLHKLSMVDIENHSGEKSKSDEVVANKIKMDVSKWQPWKWQVILSGGVARACYCETVFHGRFSITFIGAEEDTLVAKELFVWLKDQIYRLGIEESRKYASLVHPLRFRPNFWLGCAERVASLLFWKRDDMERENAKVTALVRTTDLANREYMERAFSDITYIDLTDGTDEWSKAVGYAAGDKIDLDPKKRLTE